MAYCGPDPLTHTSLSAVLPYPLGQWKDLLWQPVSPAMRKHQTMPSMTRNPTGGPILHLTLHPPAHPKHITNIRVGQWPPGQQDTMVATRFTSPTEHYVWQACKQGSDQGTMHHHAPSWATTTTLREHCHNPRRQKGDIRRITSNSLCLWLQGGKKILHRSKTQDMV